MDYAPIALQATDVLVDKHFHKIPDKAFRSETYKPRVPFKPNRRKRREEQERRDSREQEREEERRNSGDQEDRNRDLQRKQEEPYKDPEIEEAGYDSEPDYSSRQRDRNMRGGNRDWDSNRGDERDEDREYRGIPRHSGAGTGAGYGYSYPYSESTRSNSPPRIPYSQQPARIRPEYLPKYNAPPNLNSTRQNPYYFPPPLPPFSESGRDERDYGKEKSHRPKVIQRRSSYDDIHTQRSYAHSSHSKDQKLTRDNYSRRPRSDHGNGNGNGSRDKNKDIDSHVESMKDRAERYGVKEEVKGLFTKSPQGLAGGTIGALVGGWATGKWQESRSGRGREGDAEVLGLLIGAAAGGLVGNVVVDRWEEGRKEKERENEKGGKGGDSKSGERGRDRDRDGGRREERRDSIRGRDRGKSEGGWD